MNSILRRWLAVALFLFFSGTVFADIPIYGADKGIAIGGYDPVAYFTVGKPQKGRPEFKAEWSGAIWHFASSGNRDLFIQSPQAYAPQYGGFCAYAMSQGGEVDGNGERWKIVDGKLYLNNNWVAQKIWQRDIPGRIKNADQNWPEVKIKIQSRK